MQMNEGTIAANISSQYGLYKFLNSEDVHYLEGSQPTLKFGRLRYYRLLEIATLNSRIGDRREGLAFTRVDKVTVGNGQNEDIRHALEEAGIAKVNGGELTLQASVFSNEIDCFVMSLGAGSFKDLSKELAESGPDAYDAALELSSFDQLIRAIGVAEYDGHPLRERFEIYAGSVQYGKHEPSDLLLTGRVETGDPFFKDEQLYKHQSEFRLALIPKGIAPKGDNVFVQLQGSEPFFQQKALERRSSRIVRNTVPEDINFEAVICECFAKWSERTRNKFTHSMSSEEILMRIQEEEKSFEPIRRRLIDAYWSNRHQSSSDEVDAAIANKMPHSMFNSRFALFANFMGIEIYPPL